MGTWLLFHCPPHSRVSMQSATKPDDAFFKSWHDDKEGGRKEGRKKASFGLADESAVKAINLILIDDDRTGRQGGGGIPSPSLLSLR